MAPGGALGANTRSISERAKTGIPNWINSLEEDLDKLVMIVLRDNRKLIGYLRSFDQFGNLVTEGAIERIIAVVPVNESEQVPDAEILVHGKAKRCSIFADIYVGTVIVRGENIILFGVVDQQEEENLKRTLNMPLDVDNPSRSLFRRPLKEVLAQKEKNEIQHKKLIEQTHLDREDPRQSATSEEPVTEQTESTVFHEENGIEITTTVITRKHGNLAGSVASLKRSENSWADEYNL